MSETDVLDRAVRGAPDPAAGGRVPDARVDSAEADDAVQEAWLRLSRADASDVDNLPAG